jgi:hypothetical protein
MSVVSIAWGAIITTTMPIVQIAAVTICSTQETEGRAQLEKAAQFVSLFPTGLAQTRGK